MKKHTLINLLEIIVLLTLPMLSPQLNILYVVFVIIIILVSRHLRKEKWSDYGFKSVEIKWLFIAAGTGITLALLDNYLFEPLFSKITGKSPDLSTYQSVKGNIGGLIGLLAVGWVIGGFFEEVFFRGYMLNRINLFLKNHPWSKWVGIVATSIPFAIAHSYQDTGGMINTFYFSIILGILYYYLFKKNVWNLILIHGFYDTVGIIYLFLGY